MINPTQPNLTRSICGPGVGRNFQPDPKLRPGADFLPKTQPNLKLKKKSSMTQRDHMLGWTRAKKSNPMVRPGRFRADEKIPIFFTQPDK